MSSRLESASADTALCEAGPAAMQTPEDISEFCNATVRRRMLAAADDVISRYKRAVKGSSPEQQIALTRAMLHIRNRRTNLAADDRAGLTTALWEFTDLATAAIPGGRRAPGTAVPGPRAAPRSRDRERRTG